MRRIIVFLLPMVSPLVCLSPLPLLAACGGGGTGQTTTEQRAGSSEDAPPADAPASPATVTDGEGGEPMAMLLTSPAFGHEQPIPARFTCEGEDHSPRLAWEGVPEGTSALALICDDPDAPVGTWVHWVIYNLPAAPGGLAEGISSEEELTDGTRQGRNSWRRIGYGGPCPPPGKPHRYIFKLYALDVPLELAPGADKPALLEALEGHVLAEARLLGTFQR